jgi:hypothetical protein
MRMVVDHMDLEEDNGVEVILLSLLLLSKWSTKLEPVVAMTLDALTIIKAKQTSEKVFNTRLGSKFFKMI